jgi:hypothetical protein
MWAGASASIAVDASSVYWMSGSVDGALLKIPIAGGATTVLATGQQGRPQCIAVDATSVYWTNGLR